VILMTKILNTGYKGGLMEKFGLCFYCRRVISCYPKPYCRDCDKDCEFRGKHSFDLNNVEIRFKGSCSKCYNELIRDID